MAEPTKDDLVEAAQSAGIPVEDPSKVTKNDLAQAIETAAPAPLGPVVPEGQITPEPPAPSRSATVGVQPLSPEDIPEAAR